MLSPTLQYDSPELDAKLHLRIYKSKFVRDFLRSLDRAAFVLGFSLESFLDGQNFPAKSRLFASLLLGLRFGFQVKFPAPFL